MYVVFCSLLKVHLQLRGFSVFLDIEKLKAGKFDENLLSSVKLAKNFILVLTPNALDRCMGDDEQNDWVHKVDLYNIIMIIKSTFADSLHIHVHVLVIYVKIPLNIGCFSFH